MIYTFEVEKCIENALNSAFSNFIQTGFDCLSDCWVETGFEVNMNTKLGLAVWDAVVLKFGEIWSIRFCSF